MMDSFLIVWILFRESISDKIENFGACFLFLCDVDSDENMIFMEHDKFHSWSWFLEYC